MKNSFFNHIHYIQNHYEHAFNDVKAILMVKELCIKFYDQGTKLIFND